MKTIKHTIEIIPSNLLTLPENPPKYDIGQFVDYKGQIVIIKGIEVANYFDNFYYYKLYDLNNAHLENVPESELNLLETERIDFINSII